MSDKNVNSGFVLSSLIWKFSERIGSQLVSSLITIVIARILDPEAYGVVAIISIFLSIASVFVDSGLGSALIQKKNPDDLDYSTVFFTNIAVCSLVYTILFLCAPLIASFYNNQLLTRLIRVAGISIIVSSLKNVQDAYISKNLMFKKFFYASLFGTIVAGIVGIVMAYNGFGAWSLVFSTLTDNVIDTFIIWLSIKWRPKLIFSFDRLKSLFSFGSKLLVSNIINKIYDNLYKLVIGKFYSASDLAYYDKAENFPSKITNNINDSINGVLMPVMSNCQDDIQKTKKIMQKMLKSSFCIMTPLMIGLATVAKPLTIVVLGEKWLPIVPYMRVICVIYLFRPLHTANLIAIQSQGRSDIFLKLEIIKKIVGLLAIILVYKYGVLAMTFSMLAVNFVDQLINSYPNSYLIGYSYLEQLKDIAPNLIVGCLMAILVYSLSFINMNEIVLLILSIVIGAIFYISISYMFKLDSFYFVIKMIKDMFNRKIEGKIKNE